MCWMDGVSIGRRLQRIVAAQQESELERKPHVEDYLEELSHKERLALEIMLSPPIKMCQEVARQLGVSGRTLRRWRSKPAFRKAYDAAWEERFDRSFRRFLLGR